MARSVPGVACLFVVVCSAACGDDAGTGGTGGGGSTTSTTTTTATTTAATNGSTTTTTTGMGGEGGGTACTPGAEQPCYTGPAGTEDVGLCHGGTETCLPDGSGFGSCEGEVVPATETCTDPGDEDCDGETNEEGADCACVPGSVDTCYSFDPLTEGVGPCKAGMQTCNPDGLGYGPCMGEVGPAAETCNTPVDDDCDGETNEEGAGCVCLPNSVNNCYDGPPATLGVGICAPGSAMCNGDGTALGPCVGQVLPATENCAQPADEDCDGIALLCLGNTVWSKRFGDAASQAGAAIATDPGGNVLFTGSYAGTIDFGGGAFTSAGTTDGFLAKLDSAGGHVWSKTFGNASAQEGTGVATDTAGNVLVIGRYAGSVNFGGGALTSQGGNDVFVAKLDSAGNHLWSKSFGDAVAQEGTSIAVDAAGNVLITGRFAGNVDFGGGILMSQGGNDIFVAKLDSNGNHLWSKRFGDAGAQEGRSIAVDAAGNVLLSGSMAGSADFGGGSLTSAGGVDIFVAKLDPDGNHLWSKLFGDAATQLSNGIAADPAGNVLLTGSAAGSVNFGGGALTSAGGSDIFVAKLDPAGNHLWSKLVGDAAAQEGASIAADPAGNVVVTGRFAGNTNFGGGVLSSAGGNDAFVAKLDELGAHLWAKRFGSAADQRGLGIATDTSANVLVTGSFQGTADFGVGALMSAGSDDVFALKLAP